MWSCDRAAASPSSPSPVFWGGVALRARRRGHGSQTAASDPIALVRRGHFPFAASAKGKGKTILNQHLTERYPNTASRILLDQCVVPRGGADSGKNPLKPLCYRYRRLPNRLGSSGND